MHSIPISFRIIIILFPILLLPMILPAQTVRVIDAETEKPLVGVNVYSKGYSSAGVTNSMGEINISGFEKSNVLIFRYIGYETDSLAYDELQAADFVVALQSRSLSMDDLVVSANRWQQNAKKVPMSIATVTPEQVQFQNPQTAADLLEVSGEVFVQKSQLGGGSPMLRGFATNRVLLSVDGVRMNNAIFRSGNLQNVISLDANSIGQTEVIFGPGSVIYGSDAIGGVMSFKTLQPKFSTGSKARITGNGMVRVSSANEERTGHVDVNIGLQKWAFLSSVTVSDYDAQRMGSNGPDDFLRRERVIRANGEDIVVDNDSPEDQLPTGFSQLNAMQKFRFRPNSRWDLNLDIHYSTTGDIPRFDRLIERRDGQFRKAEWFYGPQQWFMGNFHTSWFAQNSMFDNLKTTIAFQDYEESRKDRNFNSPLFRNREEEVKIFSANFDFQKEISPKGTLFYGLEGVLNWVDSDASVTNIETGETNPAQTRYPDGSTWQSYAGFINYEHDFSPRLNLTAGARYNQYLIDAPFSDRFFDFPFDEAENSEGALTGSLGSVFRPDESWKINAHISTGFRAPNIDDIGKVFDSEPGSVVVPNPNIDAEYAWNFEMGVRKSFGNQFSIDVTGFYTILNDALVRRDFTFNGQDSIRFDGTLSQVQALRNASDAWVWGIQGGIDWQATSAFSVKSRINFQEGEQEDENGNNFALRHVAPLFGRTQFILEPLGSKYKVELNLMYNGSIPFEDLAPSERGKPHLYATDENGNPFSPAWYTLNLKTSYQINEKVSVNFGLENMTDQRYRTYSSGIAAPGINAIAAIRASL